MTIRHLLTHTAGLAYWTPVRGTDALSTAYRARGITPGNYYTAELRRPGYGPQAVGLNDMVKRIAEVPLAAEPGTVWRYSVGLDVQVMPPTSYPVWTEVDSALDADRALR